MGKSGTLGGGSRAILFAVLSLIPRMVSADDVISASSTQGAFARGQRVQSFYVRAVTGPLRDKSVCYVCRNGDRPVVMILLRELEPELPGLLKSIDGLVDRHRAQGLRAFGVLIGEDPTKQAPRLQTLGFDKRLSLPLAVAGPQVAAAGCQNIPADAVVTVILYRDQKIEDRRSYLSGELSAAACEQLLTKIGKFAAE